MSNLHEILQTESGNTDKIHFYREGVFYKAYERSAYAFVTQVKAFQVKKRFIKSVNREVVSIGFPTHSLHSYFGQEQIKESGNTAIISLHTPIERKDYEVWRESVALTVDVVSQPKQEAKVVPLSEAEQLVTMKIKTFPIETKTPLECMLFLSELKKTM